jgi:hypothetical protein
MICSIVFPSRSCSMMYLPDLPNESDMTEESLMQQTASD